MRKERDFIKFFSYVDERNVPFVSIKNFYKNVAI